MKILVIGGAEHFEECRQKFGSSHAYLLGDQRDAAKVPEPDEVIFDFTIDEDPHEFELYADRKIPIFLNTCKISLDELSYTAGHAVKCTVFGFNGLPTMLNRSVLEVSILHQNDRPILDNICKRLNTEYLLVDDRVGLVTPRVICMIINEAYYTVQEGTAAREDIDMAMKLGTNYPFGPFEWCKRIGIKHVYELLEAVYEDTRDERYKICPLLKKEYLQNVS
jgi:3-hydroxybutyryl-CoA dehydrogenase